MLLFFGTFSQCGPYCTIQVIDDETRNTTKRKEHKSQRKEKKG